MERVKSEDIENLEGSGEGRESLDVVDLGLEGLDKGVGGGKAVSKLNIFGWKHVLSRLTVKTLVLHAVDESEPESRLGGGIKSESWSDSDRDAGTKGSTIHSSVCMDELGRVDSAVHSVKVDHTLAVGSLELVLHASNSLGGPAGVIVTGFVAKSGFGFL